MTRLGGSSPTTDRLRWQTERPAAVPGSVRRNVRFTRHGRIGPLLRFLSVVVVSLTTGLFRREWRHLERIPKTGPAILAVNHVSYADPFIIARLVWDAGRIPRFLGKAPLFEVPVVGHRVERRRPDPGTPGQPGGGRFARVRDRGAASGRDRGHLSRRHGDPRRGLLADAGQDRGGPAGPAGARRPGDPGGPVGIAELRGLVPPPVPAAAAQAGDHLDRSHPSTPPPYRSGPGGPGSGAECVTVTADVARADRRDHERGPRRAGRYPRTAGSDDLHGPPAGQRPQGLHAAQPWIRRRDQARFEGER